MSGKFELVWEEGYKLNPEEWGTICREIADRYDASRVSISIEHPGGARFIVEHDEMLRERIERGEFDR